MIETLFEGLALVVQWPAVGYLLLGIMFGLWLGAVPGLGGITGLVILLPFTFTMDPVPAFALMLGMYAPVAASDTISSVMLGIPGTAASQATILDGHPLAQQGQATRALGAAYFVSAVGGVLGGIVMAASMPLALPIILSFGTPEFFLLGVLGLTMVGAVSGGAASKGVMAAVIGLLISQVGFPVASDDPRYTFELSYLLDGFPIIPVVLGLFGIPEMLELATRNSSIARVDPNQMKGGGILAGIRDAIRNRWLVLRCSMIGIYIGMLPGMGGAIADWVAYGHAVQSSKDKSKFGKGDIRGVIGPESANNAVAGGSLIPTLALGIPGSAGMAILLGALLIQGLTPGREMLTDKLDLTFSMVWMLILANVIGAGFLMLWGRQVAKAAFINGHYIVPAVIVFLFMGAWLNQPDILNWISLLAFGALGFLLKKAGWPRPPVVLGFVLGPIMENAFVLSNQSFTFAEAATRPIAIIIVIIIIVAFYYAVNHLRKAISVEGVEQQMEGGQTNPFLSTPFTLALLALFIWAGVEATNWRPLSALFPLAIAIAGAVLLLFVARREWNDYRRLIEEARGDLAVARKRCFSDHRYAKSLEFLAFLAVMIALTPVIGQIAAILVFVAAYLKRWGGFPLWQVAAYTFAAYLLLYGIYDKLLHVPFALPFFID